jgi:hypothetical protein
MYEGILRVEDSFLKCCAVHFTGSYFIACGNPRSTKHLSMILNPGIILRKNNIR